MNFVFLLTGLAFVFSVSWIFSNGRDQVRYKKMAVLFGLQLVISYLCLHTSGGISALTKVSHFFSWLMDQAAGGVVKKQRLSAGEKLTPFPSSA